MAVYTLSGSGTRALSANVVQVRVEILALPPGAHTGHAAPVDYFGVGFLRFGVQGSYLRKLPIDGFDILLDVPANATTIGWYVFPPGSIRVTEMFASTTPVGNPLRKNFTWNANVNAGAVAVTLWSYTVPANRLFRMSSSIVSCPAGQPQTTSCLLALGGIIILQQQSTTAVPSGLQQQQQMPTQLLMGPGEVLAALAWNAASTAQFMEAYVTGWEFDQATWVPAA